MAESWSIRNGSDAVERAYRRHWRELCRYVARVFGAGPPDPEDVVQQAFAAYAALERPEAVANPRAFLYRSAANIVINHHRRAAVQRRHAEEEERRQAATGEADGITPEVQLLNREQLAIVEGAIRAMDPRRRRFLLLHRIDGLGFTEIARREGLSESAVRNQIAKASYEIAMALKAAEEEK